MNVDRRDIENIIVENKDTQTFTPENDMKETRDTHDQISETYQGLRQRNKKKKMKRRHSDHKLENPHVVSMTKEDEKKINRPMMSYGNLYTTNWNPVFSMTGTSDHVIDIYDEEIEQDNNFFLSMDSCFKNRIMDPLEEHKDYNLSETQQQIDLLEEKIRKCEKENQELKQKNQEYISKIQGYECNSILELNRKIRTGIPVRFFPYRSNHTLTNTSHINTVDLDLH
jgi:hypothetical protein